MFLPIPERCIQVGIFIVIFYAAIIALAGYLVAADSGRRGMVELWLDILVFALVPLLLVIVFGLVIGLALCAVVWAAFFLIRGRIRTALHYTPPVPLESLKVLDAEGRTLLLDRAIAGGFWFAILFALVQLIVDLIFYFTGSLPNIPFDMGGHSYPTSSCGGGFPGKISWRSCAASCHHSKWQWQRKYKQCGECIKYTS